MSIIAQDPQSKQKKLFGFKDLLKILINFAVLFFVAITGYTMFTQGRILAGIFFLPLSLVVLIPQKYLKVTNFIRITIVVVLYLILAAIFGQNMPKPEINYENYNLGQEFTLDLEAKFVLNIKSIELSTQAKIGDEVLTSTGNFLAVKGTVKNSSTSPEAFLMKNLAVLKDSQGRSYTMRGATIPTEALQPDISKDILYVFEIPKDATDLKLEFQDKTGIIKTVSLGR